MKQLILPALLALGAAILLPSCEETLGALTSDDYVGTLTVKGPQGTQTDTEADISADTDVGTFDITGYDVDFSLSIEEYAGSGSYTLKNHDCIADYSDDDDFYTYEDGSGHIEITETKGERISGTFSFSAENLDGNNVTISGSFDMKAE